MEAPLAGKTVVLAVTGGIAAYKAVEVARLLKKLGARVVPILTKNATKFVGAVTFSGITGESVHEDLWDSGVAGELHVLLAAEADLIAVVPATADSIARMASGRCDDLLTATLLCTQRPVLVAPAMHPQMWKHPATAYNTNLLRERGTLFIGPVDGPVASGESGLGRMAEPSEIAATIQKLLLGLPSPARSGSAAATEHRDLVGKHVVVTAGPTHEPIDPVRFLGNLSSGKMGFAIAEAAARRGATVTLIAGPVHLPTPIGVRRCDVVTARELRDAVLAERDTTDVLVMAAAVADFRPREAAAQKIKKSTHDDGAPVLELVRNPDILASVGAARTAEHPRPTVLVGFALETGDDAAVIAYARDKIRRKKCDLIVANRADQSLGKDENRVFLVADRRGDVPVIAGPKTLVASRLLDVIVAAFP
jgi:phosphopantothenoylcysteine decarboxylase/phosphopantothenate--cysteine ligase